jgi:hypothetical protein
MFLRYYIHEDGKLQNRRCEKFKSCTHPHDVIN